MSRYRRATTPGGTFFFTVNLADRRSALLTEHIDLLRAAYTQVARELPFDTVAVCILPDHLHAVWKLPPAEADFSTRWQRIKAHFSQSFPAQADRSDSKQRQREKGIWQRRFREHHIRDDADLQRHVDYIHYNPVKNGLVQRVADWPHSSFIGMCARDNSRWTGRAVEEATTISMLENEGVGFAHMHEFLEVP